MKTKRHAKAEDDALKSVQGKKRHSKRKHSPALMQVPPGLDDILKLVNLLPPHLRSPFSARRDVEKRKESRLARYTDELARTYPEDISEDVKNEWTRFLRATEELPLMLRAFVLQDDQGEMFESDGQAFPSFIRSDLQTLRNIEVLHKSETGLIGIVRDAEQRIIAGLNNERPSARETLLLPFTAEDKKFTFVSPSELLSRARQRLIYVFATQETLSCLTHPDAWMELLHSRPFSRFSDATQTRLYISQRGEDAGRLALAPPALYEHLAGIEAARIRECPVCYGIFWAGRKDMRACSGCAHTLRSREYRKSYKPKYSRQRSQQRQSKARKAEQGKDKTGKKQKTV